MPWNVSPADVLGVTGASATAAQIAVADSIVTIYVNRTSAASGSIAARDLEWIKSAIAWETLWAAGQPDLLTRNQFDSISQDGLSVATSAQWAKMLHPLAARALKNLSWKASRTVRTPNVSQPVGNVADFNLESSDYSTHWGRL